MSNDTTTPTPTISEAELFAEFMSSEIPQFNTRGMLVDLIPVNSLLEPLSDYVTLQIEVPPDGADVDAFLEYIEFDLRRVLDGISLARVAYGELKDERALTNDDGEAEIDRFSAPPIEEAA